VPGRVVLLPTSVRLLGEAAATFLAQPDLAASTRRSYEQTLNRLERELSPGQPLGTLTADQLTSVVTGAWGAGDLEPTCRHRPLLPWVLPAAALAGRGPHRRPGSPARADRPHQGHPPASAGSTVAPR